jgi:hypothetical protein
MGNLIVKKKTEQENYQEICQLIGENISAKKLAYLFFKNSVCEESRKIDKLTSCLNKLSHDFIAELKLKEEGEFQNVKDGKKSILEIYEILLRNDEDKDTGGKEKKRQRQLSSSSLLKKALKMYELIICYNYELQQSIHESSSLESCSVFYLYKKFVTHNGVSNHLVIDFFRQIIVDAARLKIIIDEDNLVEDDDSGRQRLYYDLYSLFKTDLFNDLGNNPVNKPDNCLSAGNYGHQLLAVSKCIDVFKF